MASDKGAHKETLDERLAQARDAILFDGEEILAQEMGDQGQAIVLARSRILVIKAGLTATGTLNGQIVGAFPFDDITAVTVRRGPIGAVIHIGVDGRQENSQAGFPDNVIVFSGEERIKKCSSIADKIETTLGRPVNRVNPETDQPIPSEQKESIEDNNQTENLERNTVEVLQPEDVVDEAPKAMKGGREAKSLAEEMFEEMSDYSSQPSESTSQPEHRGSTEEIVSSQPDGESQLDPVVESPQETVESVPQPQDTASEESPSEEKSEAQTFKTVEELGYEEPQQQPEDTHQENAEGFRPNPFLPKPVRRKNSTKKSFIVTGGLMILVVVGIAVTSPLRHPKELPAVEINVDKLTRNAKAIRLQIADIHVFRDRVNEILDSSNKEAAALVKSMHSGRKAIIAAAGENASDKAWQELGKLQVPSGLAGAKESLVLALFTRKNAVANALSVGPVDKQSVLARLSEANTHISRGLQAIDKMEAELNQQLELSHSESNAKTSDPTTE